MTDTIKETIDIDSVIKAMPPIEIPIITKIKMDRLHDLLCTALEGGVGYWCQIIDYTPPEGKNTKDYQCPHLDIIFDGGSITVKDYISEDEGCDPVFEPKEITLADLKKGLEIMNNKYNWHFENFINDNDNDDAETGDVFFQCAVMGDIVFG